MCLVLNSFPRSGTDVVKFSILLFNGAWLIHSYFTSQYQTLFWFYISNIVLAQRKKEKENKAVVGFQVSQSLDVSSRWWAFQVSIASSLQDLKPWPPCQMSHILRQKSMGEHDLQTDDSLKRISWSFFLSRSLSNQQIKVGHDI